MISQQIINRKLKQFKLYNSYVIINIRIIYNIENNTLLFLQ